MGDRRCWGCFGALSLGTCKGGCKGGCKEGGVQGNRSGYGLLWLGVWVLLWYVNHRVFYFRGSGGG